MTAIEIASRGLTVDQMRQRLLAEIDARPEMTKGVTLELWPDGRMAATFGGGAPRYHIVTVEHVSDADRGWYVQPVLTHAQQLELTRLDAQKEIEG